MNRMKKFASIMLALVMAFALMAPAFASTGGETTGRPQAPTATTGSITINNASKGHTYSAYQIFDGDLSYDSETGGDLTNPTLSNVEWGTGVNETAVTAALADTEFADMTAADIAAYLSDTKTGGEATARKFAQAISGVLAETAQGTATIQREETSCTISGLDFGYYLIKDTATIAGDDNKADAVSLFMLQVVGPTTVESKVGTPSSDKKIVTGENSEGREVVGGYNIGDTVKFELTATLGDNYDKYTTYKLVFHDTMSKGLTLKVDTIVVKMGNTTFTQVTSDEKNGYTVTTRADTEGNATLDIAFADLKTAASDAATGSVITVTYEATLNSDAVIGNPGNPNEMYLEFSNNPNDDGEGSTDNTPPKEVLVFTYTLDNTKVDGTDETVKLPDAEFKLKAVDGEHAGQWVQIDESSKKVTGWTNSENDASVLKSGSDGKFTVIGLDAGNYELWETKAPVGYNKPEKPFKIEIKASFDENYDGSAKNETVLESLGIRVDEAVKADTENPEQNVPDYKPGDVTSGVVGASIENNKGAILPETGGIGTKIFYAVGGLLTVGAVVLLVTKKRMNADDK